MGMNRFWMRALIIAVVSLPAIVLFSLAVWTAETNGLSTKLAQTGMIYTFWIGFGVMFAGMWSAS